MYDQKSPTIFLDRTDELIDYGPAQERMLQSVQKIFDQQSLGSVWLLQHNHAYTAGTSADLSDVLSATSSIPIIKTNRGGKITYHGPGQRIIYTMLNLKLIHGDKPDIRLFINQLEQWIILTLSTLKVTCFKLEDLVGLWVNVRSEPHKIASIGVRVSRWVTYHGIAVNIDTDLAYFDNIIPCGLVDSKACSLKSLGLNISIEEFDQALIASFPQIFNINLTEAR